MKKHAHEKLSPAAGSDNGHDAAGAPHVKAVLDQAEAIAQGADPAGKAAGGPPAGEAAPGSKGREGVHPPPSSPISVPLGAVCVCLTDQLYVLMFGPGAGMTGELRTQTEDAWDKVIAHYLPAARQAGPLGALAICYLAHTGAIMAAREWTRPTKSLSSDSQDAASPR